MTKDEFKDWLEIELGERYPAACDWVLANNASNAWFEVLKEVDFEHAVLVIRKCLLGELTAPTAYGGDYSNWVTFVREKAYSLRWEHLSKATTDRDRRDEVLCPACNDSGYLRVADPRQDKNRLLNPPQGWNLVVRSCLVACTCGAGKEHSKEGKPGSKKKPLLEYDASRMCLFDEDDTHADRLQKLLTFWDECRKVENHPNFNQEFADYAS